MALDESQEYCYEVPVETAQLQRIRAFVREKAGTLGFCDDDMAKIELAVDEACANVIEHAYTDHEGSFRLCLRLDYQKLTVIVTDYGDAFDPTLVKEPDMQEYLAAYRVGGLGIYLMRNLMDEVDYDIQPGVKNEVRMIKYLGPEPTL